MKKRCEIVLEIHPDPNLLDEEWVAQSSLRFSYGADLADAKRTLQSAKAELDVTEAELKLAIRSDPAKFNLDKVTEDVVKSAVLLEPEYQKAKTHVIESQHDVDVLDAAVSAIDHRKKALEDLVDLFLAGYYAKPKASDGSREQMQEVERHSVRRRGRAAQGGE